MANQFGLIDGKEVARRVVSTLADHHDFSSMSSGPIPVHPAAANYMHKAEFITHDGRCISVVITETDNAKG